MTRFLPYIFFIASGACSLVYEVAWARYLGLFLGNTTLAHMCVLAAFMGGLALGSLAAGALVAWFRRPLAIYGLVEIVVGAYAAVFPHLIYPVETRALAAASGLEIGGSAWLGLKLAASVLVLLLPTFLMGATFPLLVKHCQAHLPGGDGRAEWLYAANCGGAVAGSLSAGFLLIPTLGLSTTLAAVGAGNVVLGAAAIALGMLACPAAERLQRLPKSPSEAGDAAKLSAWPIYIAIGISGATAMAYELVWIRILAVVLGSSTYSFALMVAAFITGIALGSMAAGMMPRLRRNPIAAFAAAETAIGLALAAGIPLYERLPYVFWVWSSLFVRSESLVWLHYFTNYSLCFAVMVVPTFFFGMTLPLAIRSVGRGDRVASDAGFVYGANTLGTLAGSVATGLVLVPVLGLHGSLVIAVLLNVALGAYLFWISGTARGRLIAGAAVLAGAAIAALMPAWNPASFVRGTFRSHGAAPLSWREYKQLRFRGKILYQEQDGVASVAVLKMTGVGRGRTERTLMVDGKADASAFGDMPTQVLIGQLPMLLKPDARDVLVVGLGSGATVGSVLTHPAVRVDCAEISPAVARAARCFEDVNHAALDNPRLRLVVEDARTFIAVAPRKYDVVVNQPSNPWIAGEGNLFSLDYFRSIDRALKPGGLLVQWFHTYEITDDLVAVILRTLRRVFPHTCLFQGVTHDYIIVASREPLAPDFEAMERRMRLEPVRADLDRISIDSAAALLGRQILSSEGLARLAGEGSINTDDLPVLEYGAPLAQFTGAEAASVALADERLRDRRALLSTHYHRLRPLDRAACRSLVRMFSDPRMSDTAMKREFLHYYVSRWPDKWSTERYARLSR